MADIDRGQLDELLSAYIDGELDAEHVKSVKRILREDAGLRRLLEELRGTVNIVSSLPRHSAPGSIAEDVQFQVERSELLGDPGLQPTTATGGRSPLPVLLSMAAVLGLIFIGWWVVTVRNGSPSDLRGDRVALAPSPPADNVVEERSGAGDVASSKKLTRSAKGRERESRLREVATGGDAVEEKGPRPVRPATTHMTDWKVGPTGKERIASADFEQKLLAGMGVASIRTHAFANEAVRLRVTVRDKTERDAVAARLTAYLNEHRVVDLAGTAAGESGRVAPGRSFYYQGNPDVNFAETNERQILVRASRRNLDGLMDELARATSSKDCVTLLAGSLSIRGLQRARTALYGLPEPARPVALERAADVHDDGRPLDDLTKALGLSPDILSAGMKPRSEAAPLLQDVEKDEGAVANAPVELVEPRHSLVERRWKALEDLQRGRAETAKTSVTAEPPAEPYVTLVVQVIVEQPDPVRPTSRAKTSAKSRRTQPSKDSSVE